MAKIPDEDFEDNDRSVETEEEISEGAPEWMVTYGDIVTLLLCFFVLLFSMSQIEQHKFEQLAESLRSAIGKDKVPEEGTRLGLIMKPSDVTEVEEKAVDELGNMIQKIMEEIDSEVKEFVFANNLAGQVNTKIDEKGYVITVSDVILFRPGHASIEPVSLPLLTKIKELLLKFEYQVRVEGHTDNIPISTPMFPSNWELSTNRACQVLRFMIEGGIPPTRLSAEGFAEFRPVADNSSSEGRAANRRVEIVFVREAMARELQSILEKQIEN